MIIPSRILFIKNDLNGGVSILNNKSFSGIISIVSGEIFTFANNKLSLSLLSSLVSVKTDTFLFKLLRVCFLDSFVVVDLLRITGSCLSPIMVLSVLFIERWSFEAGLKLSCFNKLSISRRRRLSL